MIATLRAILGVASVVVLVVGFVIAIVEAIEEMKIRMRKMRRWINAQLQSA